MANNPFGVRINVEVANGRGAEDKFKFQVQEMVDRIPDSKLPKIAVQLDMTRTKSVFQKQLKEIMKGLSLDTGQLDKALGGTGYSGGGQKDSYWQNRFKETIKAQTAQSDISKQMSAYYKQQEKDFLSMHSKQINGIDAVIERREKEGKLFSDQLKEQMTAAVALEGIQSKAISKKASFDGWLLNLKDVEKHRPSIDKIYESLSGSKNLNDLREADILIKNFKNTAKEAGDVGSTMGKKFKDGLAKFAGWYGVSRIVMTAVQSLKKMVSSVVELDASLVEIQKVTNLSGAALKSFTSQAYEMGSQIGRTGKEVIDATAEFRRAGYELSQSVELARAALVMTNVGDGINDVTEASSHLIAVLRGFDMDASKAGNIVDMINEVSNTAPITFQNIAEGLTRVSGTLSQTGTTLEQTIGLLTGGFASLRDIEGVSGGLLMISQRLRGIDESGQAIDGLAPKIAKEFKEIANIDIEDSNGELRSTYEILSDMARVFPTLTSKQRQYLGELAAGNVAPCVQKCA